MPDRLVQVIVLVVDLGAARRHMEGQGLTVLEGGRHPGRGTANLIVPFGSQYLELLAVVDKARALSSPQGRPVVAALSRRGPGLARWSVEPEDIDATAVRVGFDIERRRRDLPDGTAVTWRSVAVDIAWAEPWRCAFMAWDDPALHPGRAADTHPNGATGVTHLEVVVPDRPAALAWLGGHVPTGVALTEGAEPGPRDLRLSTPTGQVALAWP